MSKKVVTDSLHSVRVARTVVDTNSANPVRIMISVDGSPEAEQAVRAVGGRVWSGATEVRVITVDDGASPARISGVLPTAAEMISSINAKAAEAAQMMTEWAADELRVIGLPVSVASRKAHRVESSSRKHRSGKPIPFSLDRASSAALWKGSGSAVFLPN